MANWQKGYTLEYIVKAESYCQKALPSQIVYMYLNVNIILFEEMPK